jgi:hypothetical protein
VILSLIAAESARMFLGVAALIVLAGLALLVPARRRR